MKLRKLLSVALALCMLLSFVPMAAGAAEDPALEVKAWPGSTILSSGIYTIPADFAGSLTVNGNITVKLVGDASKTADNPYSGLSVSCEYGNTNLIIENLNVNSTRSAVLAFAKAGNTLTLEGENTFNGFDYGSVALVQIQDTAELTISGTGKLELFQPGNSWGAAIGGDAGHPSGKLTIAGGNINAVTMGGGAAIGGGSGAVAPSITITGGTVTAESRYGKAGWSYNHNLAGAAIGSGNGASGGTSNISISGGTVTAITSTNSAAIGSALYVNGSLGSETTNITVSGGKVMAYAEDSNDTVYAGGAAIGSSFYGGKAQITIDGGEVIAVTRTAAAAIGSGSRASAATVTVNGGTVTAFGNGQYDSPVYKGPAIGCGCYANLGSILINGGAVMGVGSADKNINGNISDSYGNPLNEVVLDIPNIEALMIDGTDWKVSANHADLSEDGAYDFSGEVHIWIPAFDGAVEMVVTTAENVKYYDLWANGITNEFHTVTYVLSEDMVVECVDKVYDPISAPSWNEDLEGTLAVVDSANCVALPEYITVTVNGEDVDSTYDPRSGEFLVDGDLLTGDVVIIAESVISHRWKAADCDNPKTCRKCGQTEGQALGHIDIDPADHNCDTCGIEISQCADADNDNTCDICGVSLLDPAPEKPYKITNVVSGVHVYWKAVPGATKYGLWRSETGKDGEYKWIANPTVPHFTDTKVESGKTYYYKVTAMVDGKHSAKSDAISVIYVGTPDITSRFNKAAGITVGWNKIEGATGYAIYRKSYSGTDAWVRVATIEGNETFTWQDTSVKNENGEIYRYTVRALAGKDMKTLSGCRNTGRTMARLTSRVLNSAVKASATSIKCSWTTTKQATGYEVRFMVGSTVYKTFTIGNYATGVKTFTGLQAGQTYKIQVRSYLKVDGMGFYSAWSTEKNVTLP